MLFASIEPDNAALASLVVEISAAYTSYFELKALVQLSLGDEEAARLSEGLSIGELAQKLVFDIAKPHGRIKALVLGALCERPDKISLFNCVAAALDIADFWELAVLLTPWLPKNGPPLPDPALRMAESELEKLGLHLTKRVAELKHALPYLLYLADLRGRDNDAYPPLLYFVDSAARLAISPLLSAPLKSWGDRRAAQLQRGNNTLALRRATLGQAAPARKHIVVRMERIEPEWVIKGYLVSEVSDQVEQLFVDSLSANKDPLARLNELFKAQCLQDGFRGAVQEIPAPPMEFIVPRSLLCLPFDRIELPVDEDTGVEIGHEFPVFVRPAERYAAKISPMMQGLVSRKLTSINQGGRRGVVVASPKIANPTLFSAQLASEDAVAVAITQPPELVPAQKATDAISLCIGRGIPVVLWVRQRGTEDRPDSEMEEYLRVLLTEPRHAVQAVKAARTSTTPPTADAVREHLTLLWDVTPRLLPGDGRQAAHQFESPAPGE